MKAAVNRSYGPPEILKIEDIPKPVPKKNELLIKVHASGVNRTDDGFLRAKPFVTRLFSGLVRPRNIVLGCEFAGEVVEVGSEVRSFKVGDRVFGFDDVTWGGHGQYKTIQANKMVAKIPDSITYAQAGVSGEGAHYALCYVRAIGLKKGQSVLVHGATGAIGTAAVQLFKHSGVRVVATSTTKNMKLVKKLGADRVIDWQKTDFTQDKEKFDVVFDSVGKSRFKACKPLLKPGGMYVATELGPYGQNIFLPLLSPIYKILGKKYVIFPLPKATKEMADFLAERLQNGDFKPIIDRTYELTEIAQAYHYVNSGQKTGNISIPMPIHNDEKG